jgi:hypothetical protein
MYWWLRRDGMGKRPVRSAADQSFWGMGESRRSQVTALDGRGESTGKGKVRGLVRGMGGVTVPRMASGQSCLVEAKP